MVNIFKTIFTIKINKMINNKRDFKSNNIKNLETKEMNSEVTAEISEDFISNRKYNNKCFKNFY
ncbi:hypothetical protein HERIO_2283 [Hepatospora eriocheir]|uniref:Uncharacterized protein n=1 Tax=Hepatospora eriocheir TaxID=1081669 RepID=A0A1X0Q7E9_9MICR|nr:hypothetical protein HERIO_2283 [Hepatospora eriocheir]